jgi:hypothetical protein
MLDDIQELLAADPFRPFVLAVTGLDNEYDIEDPRQVSVPLHGETIHYRGRDGDEFVIAVRHITSVVIRKEGRRPW